MRIIFLTWAAGEFSPVVVHVCVEAVDLHLASERNVNAGCRHYDLAECRYSLGAGLGGEWRVGLGVVEDQFDLRNV